MSSVLKQLHAATLAVDSLVATPGAHASDRLTALRQLSARIDSATQRLAADIARERCPNPISQQEGD